MNGLVIRRLIGVTATAALLVGVFLAARFVWFEPPGARDAELPLTTARDDGPAFEPPVLPPPPSMAYVGSHACAECHGNVCDDFLNHPMGRSLAKVSEASPLETYGDDTRFDVPITSGAAYRFSYRVESQNGEVRHHEMATSQSGRVLYDLGVPVHYAVGSGQRGRSYVINRDGLLFMSPLTWYSTSGRWDLSPGYQLHNLHFGRRIIDGCIGCHSGRAAPVSNAANRFQPNPFVEESIGCERCHGPAADHVRHWKSGGSETIADPILKFSDLTAAQQDQVCYQCHLIGDHRQTRYGRSDFDFRPGDNVADIWTIFLKGTGIDDHRATEAVSQVEQFQSSRCFQQSAGEFRCISCHDPHRLPSAAERVSFYRERCVNCHGPSAVECAKPVDERLQLTADDSCIQCHMPSVKANDVPHTSQTDHRILRDYTRAPVATKPSSQFHIYGQADIPEAELNRARALAMVQAADSEGNKVAAVDAIPLLEPWVKVVPDDVDAVESLGLAYFLLQNYSSAAARWEAGLEHHPNHEHLLRRMMVLCHQSEQYAKGVDYGQRLVAVNGWDYEYFGRLAHMLGQLDRFEESAKAAERALEINPAAYEIHAWLAEVYKILGDTERSQQHRDLHQAFLK